VLEYIKRKHNKELYNFRSLKYFNNSDYTN